MKCLLPFLWVLLPSTGVVAQSALRPASSSNVSTRAWYKVMTGYIDKYRASAYLFYKGGAITGSLYYKPDGRPQRITGTLHGSKMDLNISGDDNTKESFIGTFSGSTFKGVWIVSGNRKTFRLNYFGRDPHFLAFNYAWVNGSRKLKGSPNHRSRNLIYNASAVWPIDSGSLALYLRKEIFTIMGANPPKSNNITREMKRSMSVYLTDTGTPDEDEAGKEHDAHLTVLYNDQHMLTLDQTFYDYSGGAHGQGGDNYYNYEIQTQARIRLPEVLDTMQFREDISRLLEAQYRVDHQLAAGTPLSTAGADRGVNLFQDNIPLTNNFYLTAKGIGFSYQPYELGAYALGSVDIFLPYTEVMPYLQTRFKDWMKLR
jgi:hypothetical protein